MIISKAMDVECFINMFSVIFVDMKDYLAKFADCVDEAGHPVPLTEKLTVAEIKQRLDTVKHDDFVISDTDDSQLLELVAYINKMQSHYETITDNGIITQIPVRTDLFGFNSSGYDDLMIKALLMYFNRYESVPLLLKKLKELSNKIIDLQKDKDSFYEDKEIELIRKYRLPYMTVDVQKVYGLHSAGVNVDKDTGERNKFGKSLKHTSINLKWHELLDFTLPPIDKEEFDIYWSKFDRYKNFTLTQMNGLFIKDFDRYVLPKYIHDMMYYNRNDVFLVCELVRQKPDEVKLRYSITHAFNINVMCSARANIADKLTTKFYSDMSGLHPDKFKKLRTERTRLSFKKIIFPHIQFKTKQLQDMLEEMKDVSIYHTSKDAFNKTIEFYGTTYTLATGGIHSVDPPGVYKSNDKYVYLHHDYTSYYPSIMISYDVCPKHLNTKVFVKMLAYMKNTRVQCKHTKDSEGYVIAGVPNKIAAEALKIVINSIYGKLGSDMFFLYDRFAQMQVTINGQLMTMTLIESLELAGIHVISANTDGIVIKLPRDKWDVYKQITDEWNEINRMSADYEEYEEIVTRDINNYFDIQTGGTTEFKGSLDPKQYIKDVKKGYDMPIVAQAVFNFFVHNKPVMETLKESTNILDFCKTQNVGRQFNVVYNMVKDGKPIEVTSQRHVRFYVTNSGIRLMKKHTITGDLSRLASGLPVKLLNSLDDKPIDERDIDYRYYYEEAYKIIDPIKLRISPNQKADAKRGTKSGKTLIKRHSRNYLTLFDAEDLDE